MIFRVMPTVHAWTGQGRGPGMTAPAFSENHGRTIATP